MGCSGRRSYQDIRPEQKWDFISLNDFKSTSWMTPLTYIYLWASLVVSVAVYGVDTFTAVQLLVFDNWVSEIKPAVSVDISRWIFSVCIILSWINLGYEYWRAMRVMKRGAVAESYLDSLAVRLQSIRMGSNGRGWKRFLVFTELTKSKKGADYVALFTYFSFQAWIRIIFCSGPRQVVNALTLYALYVAKLNPNNVADAGTSIIQFFKNIGLLAAKNHQQAVVLSGMLFTLIIWVFAAISLLLAVLFYIFFLWHYIPNSDGGLSSFCDRKINERLTKIVSAKVAKALQDEDRKKLKDARKAAKKGDAPVLGRQATIPTLFDAKDGDKLPGMPMLNRNDTMSTLPLYTSRPGTPSSQQPTLPDGFELNNMDQKRPFPPRTGTSSSAMSNISYASNAPLMGAAGEMGYGRNSPEPNLPHLENDGFPFPQRSMTANSNGSQWQRGGQQQTRNGPMGPPSRQMTQDSYSSDPRGPPSRQMTQDSYNSDPRGPTRQNTQDAYSSDRRGPPSRQMTMDGYTASPISYGDGGRDSPRPQNISADSYGRPLPRGADDFNGRSTPGAASMGRRTPFSEANSVGRSSPAPGSDMGRSSPPNSQVSLNRPMDFNRENSGPDPRRRSPPNMNGPYDPNSNDSRGYGQPNPSIRSASAGISGPAPTFQPPQQRPYRNMTEPMPAPNRQPTGGFFNDGQAPRQGTPQSQRGDYNGQYTPYRGPGSEPRVASPASYNGRPGLPPPQGGYRR